MPRYRPGRFTHCLRSLPPEKNPEFKQSPPLLPAGTWANRDLSAILATNWVDTGLLRQTKAIGSIRIVIVLLLLLLGWLGIFAQTATDSDSLIVNAQKGREAWPADPEFTFARMIYTGSGGGMFFQTWTIDWPKSDRQFILGVRRLTNIRIAKESKAVALTGAELFQYPFLYSVECGHWNLTEPEILGLREYLKRGGFLFCDDFWGTYEWEVFRQNILRVLPEARISEIPLDHPVFHSYYDIDHLVQIPNVEIAISSSRTYEKDGYVPHCRGIFDEKGRLMVIINWNTDLGDAWEWADLPEFSARFSTYAYKMGINAIVYAMSH